MALTQLINGKAYDFSKIEIYIDSDVISEVSSISYDSELEPGELRTSKPWVDAFTTGEYSASGSLELSKQQDAVLIAKLGDGFMDREFGITVTYSADGIPEPVVDELIGVRITSGGNDHSNGGDALMVSRDLVIKVIKENGVLPLPNMSI